MLNIRLRMLLLLVYFILAPLSFAKNPTLTVLATQSFPPFNFLKEGRMVGIDLGFMQEIGRRLNIEIEMQYVPWKRLLKMLEGGNADAGFALFYTDERAKYALYAEAEPIHYSSFLLFVKKGSEFQFNKISDLYNKKIGMQTSFSISDEFDEAVKAKKINIHDAYSNENNIKLLLANRVEAIIGHEIVTFYNASKLGVLDQLVLLPVPVKEKRAAYLVLSKSSETFKDKPTLLDAINNAMREIKLDGTYQKILDKYTNRNKP